MISLRQKQVAIGLASVFVMLASVVVYKAGYARAENYYYPDYVGTPPTGMLGQGTPAHPYQIATCTDLQNINEVIASGGETADFVLVNDIDCSDTATWNNGNGFIPIGINNDGMAMNPGFSGRFDGQHHTISNVVINRTINVDSYYTPGIALFTSASSTSAIYNVSLVAASITVYSSSIDQTSSSYTIGGIIGQSYIQTQLVGLHFDGAINVYSTTCTSALQYVGGVAGQVYSGITDSSAIGTIMISNPDSCRAPGYNVGGLVGGFGGAATNNFASVDISINQPNALGCNWQLCRAIGGLFGIMSNGSVIHNYASGSIDLGGLSGDLSVRHRNAVGGLIGYVGAYLGNVSIDGSFITTELSMPASCVTNECDPGRFYTGAITGSDNALVEGLSGGSAVITNAYFDQQALGMTRCDGGSFTSCTAVNADGNDPNHFTNTTLAAPLSSWDFSNTWNVTAGLPMLLPQEINPDQPTNLQASIGTGVSIDLTWEAPTNTGDSSIDHYSVAYRKTGDTIWHRVDTGANETNIRLEGSTIAIGTQYEMTVTVVTTTNRASQPSAVVTGTTATPGFHTITTCQQLQDMNNGLIDNYELGKNIDCSDTVNWNDGAGFNPIGGEHDYESFRGILKGNNYTISDLYINHMNITLSNEDNIGLFRYTSGALIQDLRLANPVMISGGSGAAGMLATISSETTITNVHIENGAIGGSPSIAGGLVAMMDTGDSEQGTFTHSRNSVTGTIALSEGPNGEIAYYSGGLYGFVQGSGAMHVTDSYANTAISGSMICAGGIACIISNSNGSINNSYAAGSIAITPQQTDTPGEGFNYIGGLVGVSSLPVVNSFSHMAVQPLPGQFIGGIVMMDAGQEGNTNLATSYFDADQIGTTACSNTFANETDYVPNYNCPAISGEPNYFKNNSTNAPLNSWDFTNTWNTSAEFPVFSARVLSSITAISPDRLKTPADGTTGSTSVTPPSNTVAATLVTTSVTGGSKASIAPADEAGILGAIKHFVRSLPTIVVVAFPYALFGLLFLAALILLIELVRELRRLHILQALIHKQQLLAEERDAFWHLAANYLRAPVTLIVGGAEALRESNVNERTTAIAVLAASLQAKVSTIMKKIEDSTSLQGISKAPEGINQPTWRRAVFIVPLVVVATLTLLGDYAATSYRNLAPGIVGYASQLAGFIIVAVLFYWVLGTLTRGKSKRKAAEAQLDRQADELNNARHDLINETAGSLNPDLTKLEGQLAVLPIATTNAATGAITTLREGSSRLREIVTSFAMLIKVQENTGQVAAISNKVDLTTILNKVRSGLTPEITSKGIRVSAPALPLAVAAESDMAKQVIESIIANAVDYSPVNGTVKVEARQLQDKIQLRVTDEGQGINSKQLDHLFQPFVRADGKSAMDMSHGGFGINLYLDKLIMEQMGGSISATSIPGKGTAITMEWPV